MIHLRKYVFFAMHLVADNMNLELDLNRHLREEFLDEGLRDNLSRKYNSIVHVSVFAHHTHLANSAIRAPEPLPTCRFRARKASP
jgi:hypothetical protein